MYNIQNHNTAHTDLLFSTHDTKDDTHRLSLYFHWLNEQGGKWYSPDLETYRDYLLFDYNGRDNKPLSATSVKSHLSTIRGRYRKLLRSNSLRDYLFQSLQEEMSPSDQKAVVDELLLRIENSIDPQHATVSIITSQDVEDSSHIRLNSAQIRELVSKININKLMGLRDLAVIALILSTGIRESELCALNFKDLTKSLAGETALHVRRGKGAKERLIPYGELTWGLQVTLQWCSKVNINTGAVFRGFYRGGKTIRDSRITVRSINQILEKYPLNIDGQLRKLAPHDLRRTYARSAYDSGMDLLGIRDNLGHSDIKTTLKYIGTMDIENRKPSNMYGLDTQNDL